MTSRRCRIIIYWTKSLTMYTDILLPFPGNYTCNTLQRFQCNNHKCIPLYQKCDGIDNCGDGSDENNMTICSHRPRPCIYNEFRCANEKCIDIKKICDHADDCGDSSDELGCRKYIICFVGHYLL